MSERNGMQSLNTLCIILRIFRVYSHVLKILMWKNAIRLRHGKSSAYRVYVYVYITKSFHVKAKM